MRQAFAAVLREAGDDRLRLAVTLPIHRDEFEFRFISEPEIRFRLGEHHSDCPDSIHYLCKRLRLPLSGYESQAEIESMARRAFDEAYEDLNMERELREVRARIQFLHQHRAPPNLIEQAMAHELHLLDHVRRHHHREEVSERPRSRSDDMADAMAYGYGVSREFHEAPYRPRSREDQAHAIEALARAMAAFGLGSGRFGADDSAARARGKQLLIAHLSPEQAACYEKNHYFHVIGCHSGKIYRITEGRQQNVIELDKQGNPKIGRCFLPGGGLVAGDVMLGQKIALECEETAAIQISNPFPVGRYDGAGNMTYTFVSQFMGAFD